MLNEFAHIKKIFDNENCILLSLNYTNGDFELKYICSCGYSVIQTIYFESFIKGYRCNKCEEDKGKTNMKTIKKKTCNCF